MDKIVNKLCGIQNYGQNSEQIIWNTKVWTK